MNPTHTHGDLSHTALRQIPGQPSPRCPPQTRPQAPRCPQSKALTSASHACPAMKIDRLLVPHTAGQGAHPKQAYVVFRPALTAQYSVLISTPRARPDVYARGRLTAHQGRSAGPVPPGLRVPSRYSVIQYPSISRRHPPETSLPANHAYRGLCTSTVRQAPLAFAVRPRPPAHFLGGQAHVAVVRLASLTSKRTNIPWDARPREL